MTQKSKIGELEALEGPYTYTLPSLKDLEADPL